MKKLLYLILGAMDGNTPTSKRLRCLGFSCIFLFFLFLSLILLALGIFTILSTDEKGLEIAAGYYLALSGLVIFFQFTNFLRDFNAND